MCAAVLLGRRQVIAVPVRSSELGSRPAQFSLTAPGPPSSQRQTTGGMATAAAASAAATVTRRHGRDPPVRRGVRCGRLTRPAVAGSGQLPAVATSSLPGEPSTDVLNADDTRSKHLACRRSVKRSAFSRTTGATRWVVGYVARGAVCCVAGVFLADAAVTFNPQKAPACPPGQPRLSAALVRCGLHPAGQCSAPRHEGRGHSGDVRKDPLKGSCRKAPGRVAKDHDHHRAPRPPCPLGAYAR